MDEELCSVAGCGNVLNKNSGRGMCQKHYMRMYRKGTLETEREMHGKTHKKEYQIWHQMVSRCTRTDHVSYALYGGRGITVCERWLSFESFFADMGERPPHTSLDRINNDGNYEPSNVQWRTAMEQSNNTRRNVWIEFQGLRMTKAQWARHLGLEYGTLNSRLRKMPIERALTKGLLV